MGIIGGVDPIVLTTTLGPGVAVFRSLTGSEMLGRPYTYDIEFVSILGGLQPSDMLGQPLTVTVKHENGERHFTGIVSAFSNVGTASLNSAAFGWGLTSRSRCTSQRWFPRSRSWPIRATIASFRT